MYTHLVIGSNDIERSKRFYDAVFTALGGQAAAEASDTRLAYRHNGGALIVKTPLNGEPATASNGATIRFCCYINGHGRRLACGRCRKWRRLSGRPTRPSREPVNALLRRLSARPGRPQDLRNLRPGLASKRHRSIIRPGEPLMVDRHQSLKLTANIC